MYQKLEGLFMKWNVINKVVDYDIGSLIRHVPLA